MSARHKFGAMIDLEEKAVQEHDDVWIVSGYGSIFDNVDLGNDVVVPGAFAKSLREIGMPLLLFNHKMEDAPIGTIIDAKEDKRGLRFKAELPKDDSFVAGRIIPQLKRRGLKGTSIGYQTTKKTRRKSDGAQMLEEIKLYEISIVNLPMNPLAGVDSVKGVVPFQDLPLDAEARAWDHAAAIKRVRALTGSTERPTDGYKEAFLYFDPDRADNFDGYKFLIADVDNDGKLVANHMAVYKAVAAVCGSEAGDMPDDAVELVKKNLSRYYGRLNLDDPFESFSRKEFKALTVSEQVARLKFFGVSSRLAQDLAEGQPSADRPEAKAASPDASKAEDIYANLGSGIIDLIASAAKDLKNGR